jgi:hypothetical protein
MHRKRAKPQALAHAAPPLSYHESAQMSKGRGEGMAIFQNQLVMKAVFFVVVFVVAAIIQRVATKAIERVLTDTELRKLLCKGARRRYETMFTLSHMLGGYRRLYAENS